MNAVGTVQQITLTLIPDLCPKLLVPLKAYQAEEYIYIALDYC
jgi:hypothetical protein